MAGLRSLRFVMPALLAAITSAWGCASIIGADFDKAFEPGASSGGAGGASSSSSSSGPSSSASSSTGTGGEAPDAGQDSPVDTGPPCTVMTAELDATADAALVPNDLDYGNDVIADVNGPIGIRSLLRFKVDAPAFGALTAGTVLSIELTLTRVAMTSMSGPCGPSGPCPKAPGRLQVSPVRNDWIEGNGSPKQAIWTHRAANLLWGAPGADAATDHGAVAALAPTLGMFLGTEATIVVPLDPAAFVAPWLDATNSEISVLLVSVDGLTYVFASKETGTLPRAHLAIHYCVGDM